MVRGGTGSWFGGRVVRVIAGSLGGRQFDAPKGFKTHPMSDRARGALFNMLGSLEGLRVCDAFAGSGALGFEAISRGAENVLAIESDRAAQRVHEANTRKLGLADNIKLIKASVGAWLQTNPDAQFDIILCDPPHNDLQESTVARIAACTKTGGIFILSCPSGGTLPVFPGLDLVASRTYSGLQLGFYRAVGDNKKTDDTFRKVL